MSQLVGKLHKPIEIVANFEHDKCCGEDDVWMMPVLATKGADIHVNDRVCQFRIVKKMPNNIKINTVEHLDTKNRGGFGSTGTN